MGCGASNGVPAMEGGQNETHPLQEQGQVHDNSDNSTRYKVIEDENENTSSKDQVPVDVCLTHYTCVFFCMVH